MASAYMGIAELNDAIPIKGLRQVSRSKLNMAYLKLLETKQETIARQCP